MKPLISRCHLNDGLLPRTGWPSEKTTIEISLFSAPVPWDWAVVLDGT